MSRLRRALRAALIITATLFGLLSAGGTTRAQAAPPGGQLPTQGMYETCNFASTPDACVGRLQRLGQAGFRVVYNGSMLDGTPQQILDYAGAAQAAGLQVVWPLNGFVDNPPEGTSQVDGFPRLSVACGCRTNQELLAYIISLATSRPNTWGYSIADEPGPDAHERLRSLVERVKALDPVHPRLVMGCGICGPEDPRSQLSFLSDLDIALGSDAYPVFNQAPNPQASYDGVARIAKSLQSAAAATGHGSVMALQAWRWGDSYYDSQAAQLDPASTRFPTQQEIQAQRDAAIATAHPSLILWFTLYDVIGWNGNERPWYWAEPSDTQQRWDNLVRGAFAGQPGEPQPAGPNGGKPSPAARKPVSRFTVRASPPPARIGTRVVLDARRSYDPGGKKLRYRWTLNGHRIPKCTARTCSFRPHRSGTQRIGLRVDNGKQSAAAVKRLRVNRRAYRRHR